MIFNVVRTTAALISLIALIAGTIVGQTSLMNLLWFIVPIAAYGVATWREPAWLVHVYLFAMCALAVAGVLLGQSTWLMLTAVLSSMVAWYAADLIGRGGTAENFPKLPHLVALGGIILLTVAAQAIINSRLIALSPRWLMSFGVILIISLIQISRMLTKIDQTEKDS